MGTTLTAVQVDALDPERITEFWAELLERQRVGATIPDRGPGFEVRFVATSVPKDVQNRIHFDLTSATPEAQQRMVDRALHLGGRHVDVGQLPEETHVVLADPEGNEFCVIAAGNKFLAGTDLIGAVNCDGTHALGEFWSAALDWPLVWDEGEETAIQAPSGGSKVTWSGAPLMPRGNRDRWRLIVETSTDADIDRLIALGAMPAGVADESGASRYRDPDGNEFLVERAR